MALAQPMTRSIQASRRKTRRSAKVDVSQTGPGLTLPLTIVRSAKVDVSRAQRQGFWREFGWGSGFSVDLAHSDADVGKS